MQSAMNERDMPKPKRAPAITRAAFRDLMVCRDACAPGLEAFDATTARPMMVLQMWWASGNSALRSHVAWVASRMCVTWPCYCGDAACGVPAKADFDALARAIRAKL